MPEDVSAIVVISLVLGAVGALSHPRFSGIVEASFAILLLFALLPFVTSVVEGVISIPEFSPIIPESGDVSTYTEEEYIDAVESYISTEYGVPRENISLTAEGFSLSELRFERMTVRIGAQAIFIDTTALRQLILTEFVTQGGEARVIIDFG